MKISLCIILGLIALSACSTPNMPETLDKSIICDSPYIRFEAGCCLDQNNDKICDNHQSKETTQLIQEDTNEIVVKKENSANSFTKSPLGTQLTPLEQKVFHPENECPSGKSWEVVRLYGSEESSFEGFKNEYEILWQKNKDDAEELIDQFSTFDKFWQFMLEENSGKDIFRINKKTGYLESCG